MTVLMILTGVNLIILALNVLVKNGVDNLFARSIEKYKSELQQISEKAKFDYMRMNQDFNLWTTKRHEAYAKLYSSLDETLRFMSSIENIEISAYFDYLSNEDLIDILKKESLSTDDISSVTLLRDGNPSFAEKEAKRLIKKAKTSEAKKAGIKAQKVFGENIIYLSDEIYRMVEELLSKIMIICDYYHLDILPEAAKQNVDKCIQEVNKLSPLIIKQMRQELSGDYRFTSINTES